MPLRAVHLAAAPKPRLCSSTLHLARPPTQHLPSTYPAPTQHLPSTCHAAADHNLTHHTALLLHCRTLQQDHLSVLALPVAEFLALLHGTSYSGYSARASGAKVHPFFQRQSSGGLLTPSPRAPSPRSSSGGSPGGVAHSPRPVVPGTMVDDEVRCRTADLAGCAGGGVMLPEASLGGYFACAAARSL